MPTNLLTRISLALAFGLTSCASPAYQREWKAALQAESAPPSGCWQGTWLSDFNGHTGKLRCLVTPTPEGYKFHYQATWAKFLSGEFTIVCPTTKISSNTWKVTGSKDLGQSLGGKFHHDATISGNEINATYSAQIDHGVMLLKRVKP